MTQPTSPHVRPELARPSPYRWQEGVPDGPVSRFDMNTLPRSPRWWAEVAADIAALPACSYPEADYTPLREAIAGYTGFAPEQVVPGAGADEIIILTALLALGRGDTAVLCRPTYQLHAVATRMAGATLEALDPLGPDLRLDLDGLLERAPASRLVWLCSPNNPTGEEIAADRVAAIARACPGLVLLDQAYVELGGDDLAGLVAEHPNLVVARTFSKGWGLGALRVGYALAAPAIAGALDALRPPGSISLASAVGAERACAHAATMREDCDAYRAERRRLARGVAALGLDVVGEAGTFVTFHVPGGGAAAFRSLADRGLVVRTFGHEPALAGTVRACVATPAEDDRLLAALAEIVGRPAPPSHDAAGIASTWGRRGTAGRATRETTIRCAVDLDGRGTADVTTGVGFLDHMLASLATHALLDLELTCSGDLHVDPHHTVEDCGIVLGAAIARALADRRGLRRFADARAPLDEALAACTVDLSGRGVAVVDLALSGAPVGGVAPSLWAHMLDSVARAGGLNLHLTSSGTDDHHVVEAGIKALALALRRAVERDVRRGEAVPSTKGTL